MAATQLDVGAVAPLHDVEFSPWIRRIALILLVLFLVAPLLATLVPWQQNVPARGRVAAYTPQDRPQSVQAPIDGRVKEVFVVENSQVAKGDPLLRLEDIDPLKLRRLEAQVEATEDNLRVTEAHVRMYQAQISILQSARELLATALEQRVESDRQRLRNLREQRRGLEAKRDVAQQTAQRLRALLPDNVPELDVLTAEGRLTEAEAALQALDADVRGAEADVAAAEAELGNRRARAEAEITTARTERQAARGKAAELRGRLQEARSALQSQRAQLVTAPRAGQVFRVRTFEDGSIVKRGDVLLEFVPDAAQTAVELYVRGLDAPLVEVGRKVRLQFEGWPAVQFVGWPAVAVGTFGGVVAQIDATDSGGGRFRVLVTPDPEDQPWPGERWLRQGVRAKGWVLLDEVPLWYEIWRQLNGFPPVVATSEADAAQEAK